MNIHDNGIPDIIQFGPYRSGSTFMYQYLKHLFQDKKILKYHGYKDINVPVVITIRDFRDSIASFWRIEYPLQNEGRSMEIGKTFMDKDDIDFYSKSFFEMDRYLHNYLITHTNVLVLKYELFFDNFPYINDQISKFFNIEIDQDTRMRIEANCNLQYNKNFQKQFKDFSSYDVEYGIHGDHIHTGESTWKQVTPPELHEYFTEKTKPLLNTWGYE